MNMSIRLLSVPGYGHLYRSMLRFRNMSAHEARGLVYMLNTANLDSFIYTHPGAYIKEAGPATFSRMVERGNYRPYRTEVQLYKALAALKHNIIPAALISEQREALARLRCLMRDIDFSFYKTFEMDIDDIRTVYADCSFGLIPREDEPAVCLVRDWIYLPGA